MRLERRIALPQTVTGETQTRRPLETDKEERMPKPLLGLVLGAILGAIDGACAYAYPAVRDQIVGIVIGSTFKGLLTGVIAGFFATRLRSLPIGIAIGLAAGLLLSYAVAAMPNPDGSHYYWEIMLPGSVLGAIVGFATQRYGRDTTLVERYSLPVHQILFSVEGRISRGRYVKYWVVLLLFGMIGLTVDLTTTGKPGPIWGVATLIQFWPSVSLLAKRMHDRNRSAWLVLLCLMPLVNVWLFIEVFCLRGTVGSNRFGEDPVEEVAWQRHRIPTTARA
jgi:uncharacterized membrane protein YhaH (DUF805 family)